MVRPLIASLLTAAALLLSAGAAGAHTKPADAATASVRTPASSHVPASLHVVTDRNVPVDSSVATLLAVLSAAGAIGALGRSRRRVALVLVAVCAVVGVDAAVHSVHHLSDPGGAASCALASGSMHAPAILTAAMVDTIVAAPVGEHHGDAAIPSLDRHAGRPDRGRAPPSSSAA